MHRSIYVLLSCFYATVFTVNAQSVPETRVRVSGFIQHSIYADTYESSDTRDGVIMLYPKQASYDTNNQNIHQNLQFQMLAIQSRPRVTMDGPEIAGAKSSGMIEIDFLGTSQDYVQMIRLRHAYVKLQWTRIELLIGQYWHPMFSTSSFPATILHGAGAPFHPLNRSPQIRLGWFPTKTLKLQLSLHSDGYHKSSGPPDAARNAGIPEIQGNLEYKTDEFILGSTGGYKVLQPRIETSEGLKTQESVGSYNLKIYSRLNLGVFSLKAEGILGENLSNYVMIGGYGAAEDPELTDDYSYANLITYSLWTDISCRMKSLGAGVFIAYSGNLGSNTDYFPLEGYARGGDIAYMYRIAPRATLYLDKLSFSFEYLLTAAAYGNELNNRGKPVMIQEPVQNHRFLFATRYSF